MLYRCDLRTTLFNKAKKKKILNNRKKLFTKKLTKNLSSKVFTLDEFWMNYFKMTTLLGLVVIFGRGGVEKSHLNIYIPSLLFNNSGGSVNP